MRKGLRFLGWFYGKLEWSEIRESNPPHRLGKTLVYLGKSLILIVFGVITGYLLTYYSQKSYFYCTFVSTYTMPNFSVANFTRSISVAETK